LHPRQRQQGRSYPSATATIAVVTIFESYSTGSMDPFRDPFRDSSLPHHAVAPQPSAHPSTRSSALGAHYLDTPQVTQTSTSTSSTNSTGQTTVFVHAHRVRMRARHEGVPMRARPLADHRGLAQRQGQRHGQRHGRRGRLLLCRIIRLLSCRVISPVLQAPLPQRPHILLGRRRMDKTGDSQGREHRRATPSPCTALPCSSTIRQPWPVEHRSSRL